MAADDNDFESPLETRVRESEEERDNSPPERRKAPTGDEIDWAGFWDDFGCPHEKQMSLTQLRLAVEVSDRTGVHGRGAAEVVLGEATDAGLLEERRFLAAKKKNGEPVVKIGGWALAPEVRER